MAQMAAISAMAHHFLCHLCHLLAKLALLEVDLSDISDKVTGRHE
jgi:hypothetical protein